MSLLAIILILLITLITGFCIGYLTGRMSDDGDGHGHPYDTDEP